MKMKIKTKQWGNSLGVVLPKKMVDELGIKSGDSVFVEIEKESNLLRELFGFGKDKKISRKEFLRNRKEMEGGWI